MKTADRFDNRVEHYVKYRPHYPSEMLGLFRDEMNLNTDSVIADIGSGTGISAKLFLENGNEVIGIEPNELMRNASRQYLSDFKKFKVVNATAENTSLTNDSVNIIIAAQAFHWFNNANTLREFRRIARQNGYVALIWNERQLDSNKFLGQYEQFLKDFGTDYDQVRHDQIDQKTLEDFFKSNIYSARFENSQTLDFQGLLGRILSSSYMPSEEHPGFLKMKKTLKQLFAEYSEKGRINILYDTNIFYTKI